MDSSQLCRPLDEIYRSEIIARRSGFPPRASLWTVLRSKLPGRGIYDFFAMLPLTIPGIIFAVAALLVALFLLRHILPIYGTIYILTATYSISRMSYGTRIMSNVLIQIHREIEEAAAVAGGNLWIILTRIVEPFCCRHSSMPGYGSRCSAIVSCRCR